jgi:hypothetical protein
VTFFPGPGSKINMLGTARRSTRTWSVLVRLKILYCEVIILLSTSK